MIIPASLAPRASLKNYSGSTLESEVWLWRKGQYLSPQRRKDNKPNLHKAVCSVRSSVCLYIILSVYFLSVCLPFWLLTALSNTALKYLHLACRGGQL